MYWRDFGYLCKEKTELDRFRKPHKEYEETPVYCNKKSVRQSEFYQAQAQGYKPEAVFEIRAFEFNGATHFRHAAANDPGGKLYRIIRTYERGGDIMELTCTAIVSSPPTAGG
jgi:hypothetical protein